MTTGTLSVGMAKLVDQDLIALQLRNLYTRITKKYFDTLVIASSKFLNGASIEFRPESSIMQAHTV